MTRTWIALGAFAVVLGISGAANAQSATGGTFGQRGQFILGGERLTGYYSYTVKSKIDQPGPNNSTVTVDVETSGSQLAFLWAPSNAGTGSVLGVNPASIPRIGGDYMLTELISLGGSLGYFSSSSSTKSGGVSVDNPTLGGFALAPRVGFAIKLNDVIAFWPRVGLTYFQATVESKGGTGATARTSTAKFSGIDAVAEGYFVISPVANFGFGVAPLIELPLSGTFKTETSVGNTTTTTSYDTKLQNIGITAGVLGYF